MPESRSPSRTMTPHGPPDPLRVVTDPAAARSLLDPLRRRILRVLQEPGSSSTVAQALDLPRQRVNYHVRELEAEGLLLHLEDRRRGNCLERVVRSTAQEYLVDPELLGTPHAGPPDDPLPAGDPFSSAALLRSAAKTLSRAGALHEEATSEGRRLPTLSLEARIRFRSAREEVEFAKVLERLVERMAGRYHDPHADPEREFRITIGGHPDPEPPRIPKTGGVE
jgi:DNA-binding transcriptional ArsR family regulator